MGGGIDRILPLDLFQVNSESKANITCLVYSHNGSGKGPWGARVLRGSEAEGQGGPSAVGPDWAAAPRCSLVRLLQSFWPATTTRTSISSTPLTATEPSTSRDTRGTATTPQVAPSPPALPWLAVGGLMWGWGRFPGPSDKVPPFWPKETRVGQLKCPPPMQNGGQGCM